MSSLRVCLIIEGAYPHISGGVSSWVQSLIKSLPDIQFGIVSICCEEIKHKKNYVFPDNVIEYQEVDISKKMKGKDRSEVSNDEEKSGQFIRYYRDILNGHPERFRLFAGLANEIDPNSLIDSDVLINFFKEYHLEKYQGKNFFHNYLMWRFYFYTLFNLVRADLSKYDIYHCLSTGLAGIMGSCLKLKYNTAKFLLTEHGLYTVERRQLYKSGRFGNMDNVSDFFASLGKTAYHYADKITTVCGVNRDFQIGEGALPDKIEVINNGIQIDRFFGLRPQNDKVSKIGLVGRIVPIKDIFTFIKACKIIDERFKERLPRPFGARNDSLVPEARFYLIGPTDETKDYYKECQYLVKELGLKDKVIFTGTVNVLDYYADMDIMVLSSISEAQPIVLIEAMAAGIPIVATDVGGVRELIEGIGVIVPPCSPERIADAVIGILEGKKDKEINTTKGKEKAFKNHQITDMVNNYRRVYEELNSKSTNHNVMAPGFPIKDFGNDNQVVNV